MNRKGLGPVGFIFLIIFLIPMWIFIFGPMFSLAGQEAIQAGATGLEAFLWNNINLWFFLTLVIVIVVYFTYGGSE